MTQISGRSIGKKPFSSHISSHLNGKIILVAVCVMLFALTGVVSAYSGGGDGSAGAPYQISTRADLITLSDSSSDWGQSFTLTNDITLVAPFLKPIGNDTTKFNGTFDGQGHTISNFTIDKSGSDYIGLFGYLLNGDIKDLTVETGLAGVRGKNHVGILGNDLVYTA